MGLGGCYSIIKYLLVIFNLIFWILGIAGVVFGIWMLVDPTFSISLTQENSDYTISVIIILVASILLVIVSVFGIFGSLKESHCALITFFSLLLVIFVAEISAGVWAYINSESLQKQVQSSVEQTVKQEYERDPNRKLIFDTFQTNLHCCGAEKYNDWMGNKKVDDTVSGVPTTYNIPESCCREGVAAELCQKATRNVKAHENVDIKVIYDRGCYTQIMDQIKEYAWVILAIGIAVGAVQFFGLVFSLILAFAVKRSNRYKA